MPNCLDPIIDTQSEILVLGTLQGPLSLGCHEYYANPKNQFWNLVYSIYDNQIDTEYKDKCRFLLRHKIALWDVLKSADRKDALDSSIKNEVPNDLKGFLAEHPNIRLIDFNGGVAEKKFKKYNQSLYQSTYCKKVSSSSPTPGKNVKPLAEKKSEWKLIICKMKDAN